MTTEIQEYSQTEAALAVLREKYADVTYDVDTTDGMQVAKKARADVRGYRTGLEKLRRKIKAPELERLRGIDSEAARITAELVELEQPIHRQIKDHEEKVEGERQAKIDAEVKRVEDIKKRIENIRAVVGIGMAPNATAFTISVLISDIGAIELDESFGEFLDQAADAKAATVARLRELHDAAVAREAESKRMAAERDELDKLRAEAEKREAAARKRREKAEAKAREKREAEDRKQREGLEAQRKEQAEAQKQIDKENARLAEIERRIEQEKREETDRKEATRAAAKKTQYPGERAIVEALVEHFGVTEGAVLSWLTQMRKAA